jgi:hypothetical protein
MAPWHLVKSGFMMLLGSPGCETRQMFFPHGKIISNQLCVSFCTTDKSLGISTVCSPWWCSELKELVWRHSVSAELNIANPNPRSRLGWSMEHGSEELALCNVRGSPHWAQPQKDFKLKLRWGCSRWFTLHICERLDNGTHSLSIVFFFFFEGQYLGLNLGPCTFYHWSHISTRPPPFFFYFFALVIFQVGSCVFALVWSSYLQPSV